MVRHTLVGVSPDAVPADAAAEVHDGLDGDLGWALGVVSRRYRERAMSAVEDLPAGPRGYHVLAAVSGGHPRSQLALARRLGIDKTVMTYLLDELERAKLITRRPDPADRRARQVVITTRGTRALTRAREQVAAAESDLLTDLDAGDIAALRDVLGRLARSVQNGQTSPASSAQDC